MPRYTLIPASFLDAQSRSSGQITHAPAKGSPGIEPGDKLTCDVQLASTTTGTSGLSAASLAPQLNVMLGETVTPITVLHDGPPLLVSLANNVHEVVQEGQDSYRVVGSAQTFRLVSRRSKSAAAAPATDGLYAPMPGRIVKVLCRAGDMVTSGAPLVVLEAMKMENELVAPRDGRVTDVFVREGDAVEARAKLVKLTDA